jgi:hypothetical protein
MRASAVKEILIRELGFKKYARRWVSHLIDAQKKCRLSSAIKLLKQLRERESFDFNCITTGDESWFQYHYGPQEMFAPSRD